MGLPPRTVDPKPQGTGESPGQLAERLLSLISDDPVIRGLEGGYFRKKHSKQAPWVMLRPVVGGPL